MFGRIDYNVFVYRIDPRFLETPAHSLVAAVYEAETKIQNYIGHFKEKVIQNHYKIETQFLRP